MWSHGTGMLREPRGSAKTCTGDRNTLLYLYEPLVPALNLQIR
jgi:hypothetical protein